MEAVIDEILSPDIPRLYTAIAEWAASLVYVLLMGGRRSPARLAVVATAAAAALLIVHALAERLPITLWLGGMAAGVTVMFLFVRVCAQITTRETGYFVARAFVLAELVASLHWQLTYFFPPGTEAHGVRGTLLMLSVYGAAFALAYVIERRQFPSGYALDVDLRGLLAAVSIASITFLMSNLSFLTTNTPFSARLGLEISYVRTLVDLAGYVALYAHQGQRLEHRRRAEVVAMDRLLHSQHEQYLESKRDIEAVNRKYHDLKHWINAIRSETDSEAQAEYLDQLENSIKGYGAQVETGNMVLNTILTAKAAFCADHGITLTVVADGTALEFMSVMDVSALFGNALDNAIEAAVTVADPERRLVQVVVHVRDSLVVVHVENSYEGDLHFQDDLPRTTKGSSSHRGYGLKNMRQIAERHGGTLTVRAEEGWFTVRVLLPRSAP